MITKLTAFIMILFCLGASSLGQRSSLFFGKLGGGVSFPMEQPGIYDRDAGYNLNISAGCLLTRYTGLRADIDYDLFRDPSARGVSTQPDNPRFYMTSLKLGFTAGVFKKKTKWKPYTIGGLGIHYITKLKTDTEVLQDSEVRFSVFAGAGIFATFSYEGGLFLEMEYQRFISSDRLKANIPVRFGIVYCPGL